MGTCASCLLRFYGAKGGSSSTEHVKPGNLASSKQGSRPSQEGLTPVGKGGGLLSSATRNGSLRSDGSLPSPTRARSILERLRGGREVLLSPAYAGEEEPQSPLGRDFGLTEDGKLRSDGRMPRPANEKSRQATVDALRVVHTSQEDPYFDSITELAASMFDAPLAGMVIGDNDRSWNKSLYCPGVPRWRENPRDFTFTSYMLLTEKHEVLVVEDTLQDARFSDAYQSMTGNIHAPRFFAAAPLIAPNGLVLGSFGIGDWKPRKEDASAYCILANLAEMAVRRLLQEAGVDPSQLPPAIEEFSKDKVLISSTTSGRDSMETSAHGGRRFSVEVSAPSSRRTFKRLASGKTNVAKARARAAGVPEQGVMVCNASCKSAEVLFVDANWERLFGVTSQAACTSSLWDLFRLAEGETICVEGAHDAVLKERDMEVDAWQQGSSGGPVRLSFRRAMGKLDHYMPLVGIPSYVEYNKDRVRHFFVLVTKRAQPPQPFRAPAPPPAPPPLAAFSASPFAGTSPFAGAFSPPPGTSEAPTHAFLAAVDDEPWGSRPLALSRDLPRGSLSLPAAAASTSNPRFSSRTSLPLPYNSDVFSNLTFGPLLGRGGYGEVYRGMWHSQSKKVAVKIVDTYHAGKLGAEMDGLAEATLMEEIDHKNIMKTYTHATRFKNATSMSSSISLPQAAEGEGEGGEGEEASGTVLETWLLLEYCNKGSLQDANERGWFRTEPSQKTGKPALGTILATALELAEAMEYLHSHGIVHGDLTPANVLLSHSDTAPHGFTVKVADFGLSRDVAGTINTGTLGTVTHMPPELLEYGQLTKAADVYSFGVLLWSMYMGVPAWQGLRRTQVIYQVTSMMASLPIPPTCPPPIKAILKRCLLRDRRERPTFEVLVKELQRLLSLHQRGLPLENSPFMLGVARKSAPALEAVTEEESPGLPKAPLHRSSSSRY